MCNKVFEVTLVCDCMRCFSASKFDPDHEKYYPHYGSKIVDDCDRNRGFSYRIVKREHACSNAVFDAQGRFKSCVNMPPGTRIEEFKDGKRFCEDCLKRCFVF
ncbi:hypothetical protein FHL15_010665 [Xylaria flabelliformis]|uniref:Uncharacterized protein n=1 Tax=Xylaria flabelliformis TaxID=2512241 RepID=A0A553HKJ5_9PEZI|nr:hypothetical protein FHL15_010665 [Xylaria flabelliformis]